MLYQTQWIPKDENKEYPHGSGFIPPLVEFPNNVDPVACAEFCRKELKNEEFECIGAIPRKVIYFPESESMEQRGRFEEFISSTTDNG